MCLLIECLCLCCLTYCWPSHEDVWNQLLRAADDGDLRTYLILQERYYVEQFGPNDNVRNHSYRYRQTPLHSACANGFEKIVRLLLQQKGMDVDAKDAKGQTPLYWASLGGHDAVVKLLLFEQYGANVNATTAYGETPLHAAVKRSRFGWSFPKTEDGSSALLSVHSPTQEMFHRRINENGGYTPTIQVLLEHGANVTIADSEGQTPLHCACFKEDTVAVQLLLNYGSDVSAANREGHTPTNVAEARAEVIGGATPAIRVIMATLEPFVNFGSRAQLQVEIRRLQQIVESAKDSMDPTVIASAMEANTRMELLKSYRQHVLFPSAAQLETQIQELEAKICQLPVGQEKLDLCITRDKLLQKLSRDKEAQSQLNDEEVEGEFSYILPDQN